MTSPLLIGYERGIGLIQYATDGLTRDDLGRRPGPGDWSIHQVVVHLVDSDLVGADRMKRVIAEDSPPLLAYDENKWAARLKYDNRQVELASTLFDLNRRHMLEILQALDAATFDRWGMHSERGRETLEQLVGIYVGHLDHHLKFIYDKRERMGRPLSPKFSGS